MKKISRLFVLCVALTGMTIFGCSKKAQTGGTSTAENTPQEKVSKKLAQRFAKNGAISFCKMVNILNFWLQIIETTTPRIVITIFFKLHLPFCPINRMSISYCFQRINSTQNLRLANTRSPDKKS